MWGVRERGLRPRHYSLHPLLLKLLNECLLDPLGPSAILANLYTFHLFVLWLHSW